MISRANSSNFPSIDSATVNRLLPPLVSLVLVVLIGWQAARIVWMLVPGEAVGVPVPQPNIRSAAGTTSGAGVNVQTIADSHIFGIADAAPVEALPAANDDDSYADTTKVNLVLNGTVASEIPNYSVAIISDSGSDQQVYTIGEQIGNDAKLYAVYADRVVLNENGKYTNLRLPREFKDVPASSARRLTTTARQSADNAKSIQSVVAQNLTKLTDVIRPTPYRVAGEQVGFRVYPGRDRRQFAALGLRPGDIIKDIDGQSLTDAGQAMQIFQSLGTAEQVTVTVERDGTSETLTLKTSQLQLNGEQTQ